MASNRELLGSPHDSAAFIKLETIVASGDASMDFITGFDSSKYGSYKIIIDRILPATDAQSLSMLLSNDGGATWLSTGVDFQRIQVYGATTGFSSNTHTDIRLTGGIGNVNAQETGAYGTVEFYGFDSAAYTGVNAHFGYRSSDNVSTIYLTNNLHKTAQVLNGVRILMTSGNILSGTATLFGIPK